MPPEMPAVKICIVDDDKAEEISEVIIRSARTGKIGDGKIFVFDLQSATRIRTGEIGSQAL